jgi:hypothetical protein
MKSNFTLSSAMRVFMALLCFATCSSLGMAQSSSFLGQVTDAKGETLPGANVTATHLPSGSF